MDISKKMGIFLIALLIISISTNAFAVPYGFQAITSNSLNDVAIGQTQLSVDVTAVAGNAHQVLFTFTNVGPSASSITDVYFDDGTLLGIASISGSSGVSFSQGASPPNLPSGNTLNPRFETTAGFLADSDSPVQPNGVNPGESMRIVFNLINGQDFDDIINALTLAGADGGLRIGIHAQGFADGQSESFVNDPNPVPEPATMLLLGSGLLGLWGFRKRKRK